MKHALLALSLAASLAACATNPPVRMSGDTLVNEAGMTLYVFDKDTQQGKSACNGPCAALWPAVAAPAGSRAAAPYSLVNRDDGAMQWAYKGKPLYTWTKDQKPGDRTGDGVNGIWHVAKE